MLDGRRECIGLGNAESRSFAYHGGDKDDKSMETELCSFELPLASRVVPPRIHLLSVLHPSHNDCLPFAIMEADRTARRAVKLDFSSLQHFLGAGRVGSV